ncbi:undecaprenyl-diphosphate phosphatase [Glycomyces sp. TRM65418]|uniref:undecaprenyl-diphosphate phosphatase n=1 Tax=Glycomyces sp. TRM65418 TaxID=2867006 RepID=UPI001CE6C5D1|nr:undecaprenyl-diphosphate phosphatase [Glycomyces sp. TRM65418]MCC3765239.1 undecaprenyl-diphosphate phosphatase [Glycomyces sp. TRM65418]QZD54860.1 undecaprenyl-diphosphate phosphatase [Glycomyces sp. TRM65418]
MEIWQAVILGIVEGLTEFLPISSTGHLVLFAQLLGIDPADRSVIAFNAVIQGGAILAILVYFTKDIWRIVKGFSIGLLHKDRRGLDYRYGWYVIVGTIPVVLAGLVLSGVVDRIFNLWVVAVGAIGWSFVMWFAERVAPQQRTEQHANMKDAIFVGSVQVLSLFPGVSRSGATMTAGLLRDFDRESATRFSFLLGIPALTGAGLLELDELAGGTVPMGSLIVGIVVSAAVAYASVAWLMKFVTSHTFMPFVWYRFAFGGIILLLLVTGVVGSAEGA